MPLTDHWTVLPSRALDLEVVDLARDDGLLARVVGVRVDRDLLAVAPVLVQAREHVELVLPAAEDGEVARRVRVRDASSRTSAPSPQTSALRSPSGDWLTASNSIARVDREGPLEPDAVVARVLAAEPAVLDAPGRGPSSTSRGPDRRRPPRAQRWRSGSALGAMGAGARRRRRRARCARRRPRRAPSSRSVDGVNVGAAAGAA